MGFENKMLENWVETNLGNSIILIGGGTPKTTIEEYWDGDIPWLSVVDFNNDNRWVLDTKKTITKLGLDKSSTKLLNKGDVIISARGTVGALAQLKYPMAFNQSCYGIRQKENITSENFMFYLIKYSIQKINRNVHGAVFDTITKQTFDFIDILLPPLPEQKAIAKVLTTFDDKIELLQAQNKTLETMAQTIFKEWFGKYQIGDELPDGWRVGILDDLFGELATGNRPKGGVGNLSSGVPSIGAESIGGISNFDYSKTKYVSKEFFLNMKRGIVKEYDILIYKDGGTPGTFIPKFSMFGEGFPFKEFCINSHVFRVQPKKIHHRFYIYQWLNSYYCKWQLKNIGGKAAIPGINSTDLKNLDVIIPCDKLLYKYHDLVKNKYKKILKNMVQIQSLTKTRDTILPKLMSGQVRVNNLKQTTDA